MAPRWQEQSDHSPVEAPARPVLRLVENPPVKLNPPSWLIAPTFRPDAAVSVHEEQAPYIPNCQIIGDGPYRSIREVPRQG